MSINASTTISSTSIYLSSAMEAKFVCLVKNFYDIYVGSVTLEEKNSDGVWIKAASLASPPGAEHALSLSVEKSYAGSCTKGKTYRISATFEAGGSRVSCMSKEETYR